MKWSHMLTSRKKLYQMNAHMYVRSIDVELYHMHSMTDPVSYRLKKQLLLIIIGLPNKVHNPIILYLL